MPVTEAGRLRAMAAPCSRAATPPKPRPPAAWRGGSVLTSSKGTPASRGRSGTVRTAAHELSYVGQSYPEIQSDRGGERIRHCRHFGSTGDGWMLPEHLQ